MYYRWPNGPPGPAQSRHDWTWAEVSRVGTARPTCWVGPVHPSVTPMARAHSSRLDSVADQTHNSHRASP